MTTITAATCPLCSPDLASLIWQDDFCHVIFVDDANYPGFCRVILNAHIKEMTDLSPADRTRLLNVVFAVEAAVREVVQPDKINLASLGNVVPHLHWHVIPRWQDDVNFPDAIWAQARRPAADQHHEQTGKSARERIKQQVQQHLLSTLATTLE
jgi:diadenosine tetraphosphate (Ap4A) HIT family hydrolase